MCADNKGMILLLALLVFWAVDGNAQQPAATTATAEEGPSTAPGFFAKNVTLSGEVGMFGELYSMSGASARRPSSTGRIFSKNRLRIFDTVAIDINFFITTEQTSARQRINQLAIHPVWQWGEFFLGDFATSYSPFTMNGINIRGAAFTIEPGFVHLSAVTGETNRAVGDFGPYSTYKRNLVGGRIGIGKRRGSNVILSILHLEDDRMSINNGLIRGDDEPSESEDGSNTSAVLPFENLVAALSARVNLFDKKLKIKGELSASAISENTTSSPVEVEEVPDFLTNLFTPRVGSRADFAYATDLRLRLGKTDSKMGYTYVGPGYTSLALASLTNDKKQFTIGSALRIKRGIVRINYMTQSDNLLDQKLHTTDRGRLMGALNLRLSRRWSTAINTSLATVKNDALDNNHSDYKNLIGSMNHTLNFGPRSTIKNVSGNYSYVRSNENNPDRQTGNMTSHAASLSAVLRINQAFNVNPSVSLTRVIKSCFIDWELVQNYKISAHYSGLVKNLRLLAVTGINRDWGGSNYRSSMRGDYRISSNMTSSLELVFNNYRGRENPGDARGVGLSRASKFDEVYCQFNIVRRF